MGKKQGADQEEMGPRTGNVDKKTWGMNMKWERKSGNVVAEEYVWILVWSHRRLTLIVAPVNLTLTLTPVRTWAWTCTCVDSRTSTYCQRISLPTWMRPPPRRRRLV